MVPATGSSDQPLPCGIGWDGGTGTTWRSNPRSGVTGILLTQRQVTSPAPPPVVEDFWGRRQRRHHDPLTRRSQVRDCSISAARAGSGSRT
jgi:hypothetical protein